VAYQNASLPEQVRLDGSGFYASNPRRMATPSFFSRRSFAPWLVEKPALLLAHLLYRVRTQGAERIPPGGALLLANHLSYMDVVALQLACPRPIRFVGHEELLAKGAFFRLIYRLAGVIPVSRTHALSTTRRVARALAAGELVLLFPEGAISRTGQLMGIERGFELMARKAGVPVVPVAHDGLWSSVFSFAGGRCGWKWPRLTRLTVNVVWGEPIPAAHADAAAVRRALLDLGAAAFGAREQLAGHLGREIVRMLARHPGQLKLTDCTAARRDFTAAQLLAGAAVLARRLRATVPEPRVGIVLPPGAGGVIANLAVVCAGKVPVNLNFTAGRAAIESAMRIAGIRTVLTAGAVRARLPDFPWPVQTADVVGEMHAGGAAWPWFLAAWLLPGPWYANLLGVPRTGGDAEAGLLFTSGSAGEPKGVVLTHRNLLANCAQISALAIIPDSASLFACLPLFHSFGFTVTLWYPLLRGCRAVSVPSPLDARRIADTIRDEEVTVLIGAPTFLRPLLRKAGPGDLRSLNLAISGAEKLPADLDEAFQEKFHLRILQGYGLTETSPVSSVNQPDPPMPPETTEVDRQRGRRAGSVGRLLPGLDARILDPDTMAELPATATGLVVLRGANLFGAYLGDETRTRAAFHDGWFVTGDLGRFDDDGFLYIEGRLSRFSKIGGEMVPHGTVEQTLLKALGGEACEGYTVVVTGVPDPIKGETLVVLTTLDLTVDGVREKLTAAGLTNLWIPRVIRRVEKIPVLGTGKLDLKGCQALAAGK
jgi:acyl-[acyl-carrier-protein]-phospholipid O-acyltransferase/long-chain-fatty-acid--[acyl-carrier-protein] ligase